MTMTIIWITVYIILMPEKCIVNNILYLLLYKVFFPIMWYNMSYLQFVLYGINIHITLECSFYRPLPILLHSLIP